MKKEYYWKVEATGFIEAGSLKKAKQYLEDNAHGLVMDDEKYWEIHVEPDNYEDDEMKELMGNKN